MALGSTYSNNQPAQKYSPTVYGYRMNNAESKIDSTCLTFRYWASSLCVSIFPRKYTGNDEVVFDMDNGITIYLSHTKARILKNELELFLKDPVQYKSVGIPSGQAVITLSNGIEYGKNTPVITIYKINTETGDVLSSFAYEIKTDMYFSIRNYDSKTKEFDKCYEDYINLEIEQVITLLDEYAKASTNAVAFSVINNQNTSQSRLEDKINSIAQSLGVEVAGKNNNGGRKFNNNTFFNKPNESSSNFSSGVSFETVSIDDID